MKHFFYLLAFILLNAVMPAGHAQGLSFSGDGSKEHPYEIISSEQLELLLDFCGDAHKNEHFRLMNDLYLTGQWEPIGNSVSWFTGYFHGGGHTIFGLEIDNNAYDYAGFFGYNAGTIDSLYIEGTIKEGGQYTGGLVGYNIGTLEFCHSIVNVSAISNLDSYSGGLVGYNKGVIRNSSAQGDVTAYGATGYSGGLVGYNTNNDSNLGSITNCFARGNVSVLAFGENSTPYSGGLVGYVNSGSVAYCYTTGTPKVSLPYGNHNGLGSVIGYNHQGDISNCYYKAAVGVVGLNGKSGTTIEGKNDAGMKMKEIYVGWDFNDVWGINSIINSAYPYLRKQPLRLSDITVNSNSLSDFDSDTFDYIVDVTAANVTVSATATVTGANISVGNLPAPLATGANLDSITVEHDGGKLVYKIIVHYNYTLKFDANGGLFDMSGVKTSVTTKSVTSGINELPVVPERSGYSFKEWNTKKGGDSISFDAATIQNASGLETLYAQWSPNEYQLKFDVNGGGGVNPTPKTVVFGEKIGYDGTNLPEPVRTGYVFYRWNTLPDGSGDIYTKDTVYRISRDTTVYAQWTANEYKLKFILNYAGATNHPSDMDVTYDSPVGILPTVTRSGYIFNKWTVNPDGSGEIYTDATVFIMNTDVTLYAQWTSHPYTLKFVDTQGKTISPSSIQVNYYDPLAGKFPVLNDRPNYTFIGWNTKSDGSGSIYDDNSKYNLETDTTFYAIWEGDSYELTLDAQGGNVGKTNYPVFYGAAVGALPDPTRTSYIFGGWFTEQNGNGTPYTATTVYDDINIKTLYAKWTAKTYTLTYDPQGGTIDPDSPQQIAYGANTGILPTPIKPNYTFIEWNTKPDRSGDTFNKNGQEYTIDSDITIYAIWKGNSYKIIFDPQGGTVNPSENIVYYNEPVGGLPIPLRTGYIFGGWFTASGGGGTQYTETVYTATNNTTIYAKWIAEKYQLIFDCNYSEGPDLSGQTKNVTYGIAVGDLSNVSVTRTNYTLTGWNTEPNGKGSTYAENTIYYVNGNTTLYAQWTGKEFLITFDANEPGVTDPAPKTVYYNSPVGQLPTDIRPGYTVEWKDLSTNTVYNANTITVGDVKLTAQWTAKNYTLIFNPQGGNVSPENKSVTYGAPVGSLPDGQSTTRIGYTFDDWYTEPNGSTKYVNTPAYNKYNVAGNSTVYAKWTGNPYTLYFNVNGGDGIPDPNSIPVIYGSPVGPLSDAGSKANYTFKEWNTRSDGTGVSYNEGTPYTITAGNATLYAIWQGAPYTLTFEAGGGIVDPETKTVYYNSPVGALPVPVQGGYTFTGWNTQKDGSGDTYTANTVTAGNETLYAQWEGGRTYQIKFNSNYSGGSTNIASITGIKYNEFISDFGKIPVAADLTREHYVFVRWNTEQNGSGINVDETTVYTFYDDIVLYAQWQGELCTLSFNANYEGNAKPLENIEVYYGAKVGILHDLSRHGYIFTGWNTSLYGGGKTFTSNTTVYEEATNVTTLFAQWTAGTYELFFNAMDGSVSPNKKIVTYDANVETLPTPTPPEGYSFGKWNTAPNGSGTDYTASTIYKVAGNTTIYAQWIPNNYTLHFDVNADGGTIDETSRLVAYNSTLAALPVPVRTGYSFTGWNMEKNGSGTVYYEGDTYTELQNTVLYAQWTAKQYIITFENNGGGEIKPSNPKNVTYDLPIGTLPVANRDNYDFKGWNTLSNGKGNSYTATDLFLETENIALYAVWTGKPYTIIFDANGGSVNPDTETVNFGSQTSKLPVPTRDGYTFTGWHDIYNNFYNNDTYYNVPGDITLHAQWEINNYTIEYYDRDDLYITRHFDYNTFVTLPAPSRTGYTLTEWNTEKDGSGVIYDGSVPATKNETLYAQWTANKYTVTFDYQDGSTEPGMQDVTFDSSIGILPVVTRTGYTFKGWYGNGKKYSDNDIYDVNDKVTLYAQWEINNYTIEYYDRDDLYITRHFDYNTFVTLPAPSRTGYTLTEWNTEKDGSGVIYDGSVPATKDETLYAQWTANKYTVTFDEQDGSDPGPDKSVTYDLPIGTLPVVTRTGYTFGEWNDEPDGSGKTYISINLYQKASDIILYAQWVINSYTVKLNDNYNGGKTEAQNSEYNSIVNLPVPERTGYTFDGWNTESDGEGTVYNKKIIVPDHDIILYAQWTAIEYTVTFDEQGGSKVAEPERNVKFDSSIGKLPETTRTGYTFTGWNTQKDGSGKTYTDNDNYTGGAILYAQWKVIHYNISFDINYTGSGITIDNKTITYSESVGALPLLPPRAGYTLTEWNTDREGKGEKYTESTVYLILGNTTLYAVWIPEIYILSFDSQGGSSVSNQAVTFNSTIGDLPAPSRTGYTFDGWFTGVNGSGTKYTGITVYDVTGHTILYAKWNANDYALTFDSRGGSGVGDQHVTYNSAVGTEALPVPVRTGYTFDGWFTEIDGGGIKYSNKTIYDADGNTTLYAKWTAKNYTVSFDSQGGAGVPALEANYNEIIALPDPARQGYTFKGWNTSNDGSGVAYTGNIHYTTDGDITLYAQWNVNSYTLYFDEQGGVPVNVQPVTYDAALGELPNMIRTGYTFAGWFTGVDGSGNEYTSATVYKIDGNTTLYAKWLANNYSLEFDVNYADGVNMPTQIVTYNKPAVTLPVAERPGHIFKEWNTARDGSGTTYSTETVYTETNSIVLYAQWIAAVYTISFDANYLENDSKPENPAFQSVVYGAPTGTLPVVQRSGYIFTGWNTAVNGGGNTCAETTIYTEPGNITLYAQWTKITYTVNFEGNNVNLPPQTVTYGAKILKPSDPTSQGYAFDGWFKDNDRWDFNTPVTGNILLTAKWLSGDSQLKSLSITQGTLSPEFKPSTTDYSVLVPYDVATISVTGLQSHSGASVSGNVADKTLATGDNIIRVTVMAEDGVNHTIYTILVTRTDHIPVTEADLLSVTAGNRQVTIEGNELEYVAACGETSFALELTASPHANVTIDGVEYSKGQVIEMTGEVTTVNIHIVSETGETKDYTLKAYSAIEEDKLYYRRWEGDANILGINANPEYNGGYEIMGYRWFRGYDDSPAGNKGYIRMQTSADYAEIQAVKPDGIPLEGWHRVCGVPQTPSSPKITAYPNPVSHGEKLTLELPEQFVGATLNIYNITGAVVKSGLSLPATTNSVDVSNFPSGIYLLNIADKEGNRQSVKIIVE